MSTLNLGKLYRNGSLVQFYSEDVYDKTTKQNLAQFISGTNTAIGNLESALAGKAPVQVVADITARDALTTASDGIITGSLVWVTDASDDSTVSSGAACYLANVSGSTITWTKVAEAESMDLVINWADIQNKPSSTVSQIDQAVTDSHTHSNATVLAGLSADATSGNLKFNNVELGKFTGIASGASVAAATDYSDKLQIVVEAYDPDAQQAGA
jgi:hypothetical protein